MISEKTYNNLRETYNPDGSLLRAGQLRMLEMLIFVDKICRQNGLIYWLDSGTLLGAARHEGFIPWDDDVDICMPRRDMNRLKALFKKGNLSNEFVLQSYDTDPCFIHSFIDIKDLKTEILENKLFLEYQKYRGLQIDIFPVDNRYLYFVQVFCARLRSHTVYYSMRIPNDRLRSLVTRVLNVILEKVIYPFCRVITYPFKQKYFMMSYGVELRSKRLVEDVFPIQEIVFEGHSFMAPSNVDGYLKSLYGDWSKIPDKDEICAHGFKFKFIE